ncbi:MAG: TatD family hydrolase [Chloracidobacterium sp.]|nr:TatD family hydrolase [Chloracidobacterium sp.]MDW8218506.1 TatD family hydrolase [Acidobacteriota bacterium]
MFVDSHCHIDFYSYDDDRAEVLSRARAAGVELMLEICGGDIGRGSLDIGMRIVKSEPDVYGAVGIHPHDAAAYDPPLEAKLLDLMAHPKVVAWGEIGLDYYYDRSPRDVQRRVFARQMTLARERDLPIILHIRDADEDMAAMLRDHWVGVERPGIFHCFSGSWKLMETGVELGFHISFSGNLTFKKNHELRDIARAVPLDRLLIETDCPFLSPEPYRGKRNEPARVLEVARCLAQLHEMDIADIGRLTTANFRRLFRLESAVAPAVTRATA